MTKPTLISRVRAGAALLDKVRRSRAWRGKIDLDWLDITAFLDDDGPACVLGQLYGDARIPDEIMQEPWGALGFNAQVEEAPALTRAWKRFLRSEEGRP